MFTITSLSAAAAAASVPEGWADLPEGLLHSVMTSLASLRDLLSFSSVCRSWRSLAHSTLSPSFSSLFPPLLLRPLLPLRARRRRRFSLSAFHLLDPASPSSSPYLSPISATESLLSLRFISCSHGNLLFFSNRRNKRGKLHDRVRIINIFTRHELLSPTLHFHADDSYDLSSFKGTLTAPISSPNSTLIILTRKSLFSWRIGAADWSSHSLRLSLGVLRQIVAIGPRIFAMSFPERLFLIQISPEFSVRELSLDLTGERMQYATTAHRLMDCNGDLLYVRFVELETVTWTKTKAEVLRLDVSEQMLGWVKIENLGNFAPFLSPALHVPGHACENPERWGGRSNCIYYAAKNGSDLWSIIKMGNVIDTATPSSPLFKGNRIHWPALMWNYPSMFS